MDLRLNNRNILDLVQWKLLCNLEMLSDIVKLKICHDHLFAIDRQHNLFVIQDQESLFEEPSQKVNRPPIPPTPSGAIISKPFSKFDFTEFGIDDIVSNRHEVAVLLENGYVYRNFWLGEEAFCVHQLENIQSLKLGEDLFYALGEGGILYSMETASFSRAQRFNVDNKKVLKIEVGKNHAVAITEDLVAYAWGANSCYQLGIGNIIEQERPKLVPFPEGVRVHSVVCSSLGTVYLSTTGALYMCGYSRTKYSKPHQLNIQGLPISNIYTNNYFSYVERGKSDENLFLCAYNDKIFFWGDTKESSKMISKPMHSCKDLLQTMAEHSKFRGFPFLITCSFES